MNANQFGESAESVAQRLVHDFELLMQLFPNEHPSSIHGVLCITNNDVAQAIDVLLYLQRYREMQRQQVNHPAGSTAGVSSMVSFNAPQPSTSTATTDTQQPVVKQEFYASFSQCEPPLSAEFPNVMDLSNRAVQVDDKDIIICDSEDDEKHYVILQPVNERDVDFTVQGLVPPVFRVASIHR